MLKELRNEIRDFFIVIFALLSFNHFFFELAFLPSGSMRPTLKVGDVVVVSKLRYGPRLPMSISIPLIEKKIPGTNLSSYLPIQLPYFRLFDRIDTIKHGDVVVFNAPIEYKDERGRWVPIPNRKSFVKRVVGAGPQGDVVAIVDGQVYLNGKEEPEFNGVGRKRGFFVETKRSVRATIFV